MASSGEVLDFEDYVRNRQDALLRSARRLVPDPIEAQDLLQTALVRTYGRWDGIADKSLADAYLRRVMINTRTEWWRARKLDEVPTEELPDARVEDGTEQHADRELLMDILSCLAPKQRSVVVLRHWEQMSTEETAEALGMSTGTVKSTLHRALARLRQELESRDLDAIALERAERQGRGCPSSDSGSADNVGIRAHGSSANARATGSAAQRTVSASAGANARVNGGPGVSARPKTSTPRIPAQAAPRIPAQASPRIAAHLSASVGGRRGVSTSANPLTSAAPLPGVVRQRQPQDQRSGRAPVLAVRADRDRRTVRTGAASNSGTGHEHGDRSEHSERHDRGQDRCAA
ncbi:RNA polymerase sigma-70 factor (sigma-E family) [Streptomyces zagrosensis]|uniref:RNA polymerase sigma factor n=1 Tax=Streptomyces zagrosensis TaxID=1042984 RepID=A0A7W9QFQ6_9ACTN|nr:RNA polymerase sigma-70 factor (sigma-E family) [Streptomyces zagrosensis]